MIELKGLTKKYADNIVLNEISVNFGDKGLILITGEGGCGKTTLLNILAGIEKASSGKICYNGKELNKFRSSAIDSFRRKNISYVLQNYNCEENYSAIKCLELSSKFSKDNHKNRKQNIKKAVSLIGEENKNKKCSKLSFVQKRKIAISRAVIGNPAVLICDEPCAMMGSNDTEIIMSLLKEESKKRLVIISCSEKEKVEKFSDRLFYLESGKLSEEQKQNSEITDISEQNSSVPKKTKKHFSIISAFGIASYNIKVRKLRNSLIAIACIVGIIAPGLVFAVSNGLNTYIDDMQKTTLSQYPISILESRDSYSIPKKTVDKNSNKKTTSKKTENKEKKETDKSDSGSVSVTNYLNFLFPQKKTNHNKKTENKNQTKKSNPKTNDVASLKKYLDTNPNNINDSVLAYEYSYNTSPIIFKQTENDITEIYPGGLFNSLAYSILPDSISNLSVSYLLDYFKPLPLAQEVYKDDDCLVAGHWPENSYESVLVLNEDGSLDDVFLYILEVLDYKKDIEPQINNLKKGKSISFPKVTKTFNYEDFINMKFKVVNPSDAYEKNESNGLWKNKSNDKAFMKKTVNNAPDLTIVGVVLPKENTKTSVALSSGIRYSSELEKVIRESCRNSEIVKEQLNNPEIDVLSGESFEYLLNAASVFKRVDFSNLINVDKKNLLGSVGFHPEILEFKNLKEKINNNKITKEELDRITLELLTNEVGS